MPALSDVVVASLREEILLYSSQQFTIAIYTITTATALSIVGRWMGAGWPNILQIALLISATFAVARADLLMHRAGSYIEQLETTIQTQAGTGGGWERFKAEHAATRAVPAYDLFSSLIFLILFIEGQIRARVLIPSRWRRAFLVGTSLLFLVALLSVPMAVVLSRSGT